VPADIATLLEDPVHTEIEIGCLGGSPAPFAKRRDEMAMEVCESLIDIASALFSLPSKELRKVGRAANSISRVRQVAMYVAHVGLGLSMSDVGRGFARDRTTVAYSCQTIEDLRDDPEFDRIVSMFERVALVAFASRLGR
jgi:hypothetical protein